jgi:hypothetical protein
MKLTAHPESKTQPKSISADDGKTKAVIYIDGLIEIKGEGLYPSELKQLLVVAENFKLFYENIHSTQL